MDKNKRMENQMVKIKRIKIAVQNLKAEKDIWDLWKNTKETGWRQL